MIMIDGQRHEGFLRHFFVLSRRVLLVLLGGVLVSGAGRPARAASPYDLFLRADTAALANGGGDVPGQITGQPQMRRPTSLPETDRAVVRLDYCSQTPLVLKREGATIGEWRSNALDAQYILPVGRSAHESAWTLGLQRRTTDDDIWYNFEDEAYALCSSSSQFAAALAYTSQRRWRAGAAYNWGEVNATAQGASVAEILDLSGGTTDWPRLCSDARAYTVGLSWATPRWEWGVQYDASDPHHSLYVTRDDSHYTAPTLTTSQRTEVYLARHRGSETYFLTGYDYNSRSSGPILLGALGRGDIRLSTEDLSVGIGWRADHGSWVEHLQLDWRDSCVGGYAQGYEGLLPGILGDVYTLRADVDVSTVSLRYSYQRPIAGNWSWLSAASAHRSKLTGNWRLRRSEGIGQDPETMSEAHITGGRLHLLALTLGLSYDSDRCTASFAYTGGYADVNDAFKGIVGDGDGGAGGPSTKLKPNPIATFSVEYRL